MTTNFMEPSASQEDASCPVTPEFRDILWNMKNDYCVYESPP
jgi:hypothetical protein